MTQTWRLIITENCDGAWNMALDEALLKSTAAKRVPPTLRLFGWEPATLSLGFSQPHSDVDDELLSLRGWGLVRRPTGGRAILHTDELTYSVSAPIDDPILKGSLLESYRTISRALLTSLACLGVVAAGDKEYANNTAGSIPNPVCFETPSNYEITTGGKKLIGSAQARKYGGLLQHGSLPLFGDLERITGVLRYENEKARETDSEKLLAHATTLEKVLGRVVSIQAASQAFIEGFSKAFDIHLDRSAPTADEMTLASELMETKYNTLQWTNRI